MIAARESFLRAGYLAGLAEAIAAAAVKYALSPVRTPAIVESGAGTGYYLAHVLDRSPGHVGIALDTSVFALRRAARAHRLAAAIGCDIWGTLPLADECAALVLDIFAPRNAPEFTRILDPAGTLIVVTPTQDHLGEITGPLGLIDIDSKKDERLASGFDGSLRRFETTQFTQVISIDEAGLRALAGMGPSARHVDADEMSRRITRFLGHHREAGDSGTGTAPVSVTVSVTIAAYSKM